MMTNYLSDSEAHVRLADLMRRIAHDHGKEWDFGGCRTAISTARTNRLDELTQAVARCAASPSATTPAALAFEQFWTGLPQHARTVRPSDQPKCATHGLFLRTDGKCVECLADEKAGTSEPVVMIDDAQAALTTRMVGRIRDGWRGE